ncbi:MAG: hypothetical protein HY078_09115 [Elusimicrobia bacterium]|nr:hypothetical protein [Elusimicrobiota bacterium]
MTKSALALALFAVLSCGPAFAKDPIVIIENGTRTGYSQSGLIQFAKDYESNPRTLTLEVLGHPFQFITNPLGGPNACGATCTSLRFTAAELGIDKTFTGSNTADLSSQLRDFLKGGDFLPKFVRLINAGPGGQISGSPSSTINATMKATFQDVMFNGIKTAEQKASGAPGTDPTFSGGFAEFTNDGYAGHMIGVTPGFALDFGEKKDRHLKFSFPLAQINFEGLKTYRAGLILQYLHPLYFKDGWTWTVGPGVSYSGTASMDLPNYSGLIGAAGSTSLQKDWEKNFGTLGAYYGKFNNLGGLDTDIDANILGWGAQAGHRFGQRWVAALQLVGMHERVAGFAFNTYHTIGVMASYKIFNKFDLTFSVNKVVGLPKQRFIDAGLGSAWFF